MKTGIMILAVQASMALPLTLNAAEQSLLKSQLESGDKEAVLLYDVTALEAAKPDADLSAPTPADVVNPLMGTAPLTERTLYGGPNYHPDPDRIGFSGTVYPGPDLPP